MTESICPHIEAMLPKMSAGDPPQSVPSEAAARASMSFHQTLHPKFSLSEFTDFLRNYGFTDTWDVELLVARYFYKMPLRQIASEYNYVAFKTVHRRLRALHTLLLERGIERELR